MKNYLYAVASLAAFGLSSQAQARKVEFNFLVNSSGMDIYACDAGVLDSSAYYDLENHIIVSKGAYKNGHSVDFKSYMIRGNQTLSSPFYTVAYPSGFTSPGGVIEKFASVIKNVGDGTGLVFNLGSEKFSAQYFVDFCVRGSKIPYLSGGSYSYAIGDEVTAANLLGVSYLSDALVKVKGQVVCDQRTLVDDFSSTAITDNLSGTSLTSSDPLLRLDGAGTIPVSGGAGPTSTHVNATAFNVFGTMLAPKTFVTSSAPIRLCIVRYLFTETSNNARLWDPLQAKFTIKLDLKNSSYTPPTP